MQIGYNNDVEYREKTFHIQTEDRGEEMASIETQIFHAGAILDTSILSYEKVLAEVDDIDEKIAKIRTMMQANHKKLYKKLFAGAYDDMVGLEPLDEKPEVSIDEDFVPGQDGVPAAALEVERGNLEAMLASQPEGEHVDLSKLQEQLAAEESEVDDAPTMMLTPGEMLPPLQSQAPPAAAPTPANGAGIVEFPRTGARAWRGCNPPREDLDIADLVQEFAQS